MVVLIIVTYSYGEQCYVGFQIVVIKSLFAIHI